MVSQLSCEASRRALIVGFLSLLGAPGAAHAQETFALQGAPAAMQAPQQASAPNTGPQSADAAAAAADMGDIVVTARKRSESLMSVPVSVSAVGSAQLERYRATDLQSIAQLVPGVTVGVVGSTGGASLNIRGISSPATVVGFEQSVSVAIDGIQTSNGRIATFGFFDVAQVEVLKGPQALFFGRNSPAGVISVTTAGATDQLEVTGGLGYEFNAREVTARAAVSGPIADGLGGRIALQYRYMRGWLNNTAQSMNNPFYTAAQPIGAAVIPGPSSRHNDMEEYSGRVTLDYQPADNVQAVLKVFGQDQTDNGPGFAGGQHIGPCPTGRPNYFGAFDPNGECVADNRFTQNNLPQAIADRSPLTKGRSAPFGHSKALISSLSVDADFDTIALASNTGFNKITYAGSFNQENTGLSQLWLGERYRSTEFTQELRATSNFSSPINFMAGAYFQNVDTNYLTSVMILHSQYDPVTDEYDLYRRRSTQTGKTYSVFGQVIAKLTPQLELTAGARYTHETKDYRSANEFGRGAYLTANTIFPGSDERGVLKGKFKDDNFSPEVTLSWHPTNDSTIYASYKTGYKSGGFLLGGLMPATSVIGDFAFGAEDVKGFEAGAKGYLFDRKLRLSLTAYTYKFSDLQVNAFNPARLAYVVSNAGALKQRGVDLEASLSVVHGLTIQGSLSYVRNRFDDYVGQCYAYAFPAGTVRGTAVPPPGCSFLNSTSLTLQQDFDGRAPARSPELSGNIGFVAEREIGGDLKLGLTGDVYYTDGYYAAETQSPFSRQPSFARINASLSLGSISDRWGVSLVGKNLTNKYYVILGADQTGGTSIPGSFGEQRGFVSRGREIALQTSFKF